MAESGTSRPFSGYLLGHSLARALGDALFFDAAARHGPEELIGAPMQYLTIIIYSRQT